MMRPEPMLLLVAPLAGLLAWAGYFVAAQMYGLRLQRWPRSPMRASNVPAAARALWHKAYGPPELPVAVSGGIIRASRLRRALAALIALGFISRALVFLPAACAVSWQIRTGGLDDGYRLLVGALALVSLPEPREWLRRYRLRRVSTRPAVEARLGLFQALLSGARPREFSTERVLLAAQEEAAPLPSTRWGRLLRSGRALLGLEAGRQLGHVLAGYWALDRGDSETAQRLFSTLLLEEAYLPRLAREGIRLELAFLLAAHAGESAAAARLLKGTRRFEIDRASELRARAALALTDGQHERARLLSREALEELSRPMPRGVRNLLAEEQCHALLDRAESRV